MENATDIGIGLDYGITDNLMIGINRTKGAGRLKQLINVPLKWRIISQTDDDSKPVSVAAYGLFTLSTMKSTDRPEAINFFEKFSHRMVYHGSLMVARKFGERFSFQIGTGYTHRNVVPFGDENNLVNLNAAMRVQVTKILGLIADASYIFSDLRTAENSGYFPPIGVGFEIETGGHVFQLNLTNSSGIIEADYLPYTQADWGAGEIRLGFTISRLFKI